MFSVRPDILVPSFSQRVSVSEFSVWEQWIRISNLFSPPFLNFTSDARVYFITSSESNSMHYHTLCFISVLGWTHFQPQKLSDKWRKARQALSGLASISSISTASPSGHVIRYLHISPPYTSARILRQPIPYSYKQTFAWAHCHIPDIPLLWHHESEENATI